MLYKVSVPTTTTSCWGVRDGLRDLCDAVVITLRAIYFPDEVNLYMDYLIRLLFCVYYLPAIAIVIALTHSELERIVWTLVVPVTQEMERTAYNVSYLWTLITGLGHIVTRVIPFAVLGVAVATVGHKALNCFAEAMVDACTTQHGFDYPLTNIRLQFLLSTRSRSVMFFAILGLLASVVFGALHTNLLIDWPPVSSRVIVASWAIVLVQVGFVFITALRGAPQDVRSSLADSLSRTSSRLYRIHGNAAELSATLTRLQTGLRRRTVANNDSNTEAVSETNPLEQSSTTSTTSSSSARTLTQQPHDAAGPATLVRYFNEQWWRRNIYRMRHIGFALAMLHGVFAACTGGFMYSLTATVLLFFHLNLPHMFGYMALSIAFAGIRLQRSARWLRRHREATLPVLVIVAPYEALLLRTLWWFRHHEWTCAILLGVNVLLLGRTIDLVREFDVSAHGSVWWWDAERHARIAPALATVLENSHEEHHRWTDVVSLDLTIDLARMRMVDKSGREIALAREAVLVPRGAGRYLLNQQFYVYTLPRLLALQSPANFSGAAFRRTRVVLRIFSMTLLLFFAALVAGMIIQAAFPQLRPPPVRVHTSANGTSLTLDHIFVQLHLLARGQGTAQGPLTTRSEPADALTTTTTAAALKWHNITSGPHEDFYPQLCTRNYHGVSVWELSLLTLLPYLFDLDEISTMLRFMNTHLRSDWVVRPRHGTSCQPGDSAHQPTGWASFYDIYSARRNLSMLAIRGTDAFSFADFLIDTNIFFEAFLYRITTAVVPAAEMLPKEIVLQLIRAASLPPTEAELVAEEQETWAELTGSANSDGVVEVNRTVRRCHHTNYGRDYFADVYNHIAFVALQPGRPAHVLLVGHSLGGTVAALIGAKMGLDAVVFNAPGVLLSREKYKVSVRALHKHVLTVVTSNDIVPYFGEHGGEVQHVECMATTREFCHAQEFLVGALWRTCSTIRDAFPNIHQVM